MKNRVLAAALVAISIIAIVMVLLIEITPKTSLMADYDLPIAPTDWKVIDLPKDGATSEEHLPNWVRVTRTRLAFENSNGQQVFMNVITEEYRWGESRFMGIEIEYRSTGFPDHNPARTPMMITKDGR